MAVDQTHFTLVSDEEISEINTNKTAASKNIDRAIKSWSAEWHGQNVVKPEVLMY